MELSFVFSAAGIGLLFALFLTRQVLSSDMGSDAMRRISDAIKEGAEAFLSSAKSHNFSACYSDSAFALHSLRILTRHYGA
ncbi:MAG: hypothetical protein RML35_05185 [Chloroherpetonaceae bacterium]|nr:hypothetical protein [Chloroherpetonaceae bacterium]